MKTLVLSLSLASAATMPQEKPCAAPSPWQCPIEEVESFCADYETLLSEAEDEARAAIGPIPTTLLDGVARAWLSLLQPRFGICGRIVP